LDHKVTLDPLGIDIYEHDVAKPDWSKLHGDPRYSFAILKATEGTGYAPQWFVEQYTALGRVLADSGRVTGQSSERTFLRGAYHYLKFNQRGRDQAHVYLNHVNRANLALDGHADNSWRRGDLHPIVDVELGNERDSNRRATRAQVIDCTTEFAKTVAEETGRPVILYGNGAMRDLRICDKMGCTYLWIPRYTTLLPVWVYGRAGWKEEDLFAWQYCADGVGFLKGYPVVSPIGPVDASVLLFKGGLEALVKECA
jgi:GH25 family lysozyme M1 (1,4-beta-N-acetylmuramidase)